MTKENMNLQLKIKVTCRKYAPGTISEDIDAGRVEPYAVEEREVIACATDQPRQK